MEASDHAGYLTVTFPTDGRETTRTCNSSTMTEHGFAERPTVDVLDSTWVHARAAAVGTMIADPARWRRWWPGLDLAADELRGPQGVRWTVRRVADVPQARLHGTGEIWLQPSDDGVVVHFFLRLDPAPGHTVGAKAVAELTRRYRAQAKRAAWEISDTLDPDRFARHTSAGHASV